MGSVGASCLWNEQYENADSLAVNDTNFSFEYLENQEWFLNELTILGEKFD